MLENLSKDYFERFSSAVCLLRGEAEATCIYMIARENRKSIGLGEVGDYDDGYDHVDCHGYASQRRRNLGDGRRLKTKLDCRACGLAKTTKNIVFARDEAIQDMFDNNYIHHLLQMYLHRPNPGLPRLRARNDNGCDDDETWATDDNEKRNWIASCARKDDEKYRLCEERSNPGYVR